jgi:2-polyprenyl-3-methyl-5-hydroxy-6-metoxy-1,4-benzoquinol methylase
MEQPYDPQSYWEQRLSPRLDISTVGHARLGYEYNYWLYQTRFHALDRMLRRLKVRPNDASVVDVGVGSGAYLPFWQKHGAKDIRGVDITSTSVSTLSRRYPELRFYQANICEDVSQIGAPASIVTAFDILFHVTDDEAFARAGANLAKLVAPGGSLIISDSFCDTALGPFYHEYHRSYDAYAQMLAANGMQVVLVAPIFFTMTTTMCGRDSARRLNAFTQACMNRVQRLNARRWTAWLNHVIGASLCLVDSTLASGRATGPSLKLLAAQHAEDGRAHARG